MNSFIFTATLTDSRKAILVWEEYEEDPLKGLGPRIGQTLAKKSRRVQREYISWHLNSEDDCLARAHPQTDGRSPLLKVTPCRIRNLLFAREDIPTNSRELLQIMLVTQDITLPIGTSKLEGSWHCYRFQIRTHRAVGRCIS